MKLGFVETSGVGENLIEANSGAENLYSSAILGYLKNFEEIENMATQTLSGINPFNFLMIASAIIVAISVAKLISLNGSFYQYS